MLPDQVKSLVFTQGQKVLTSSLIIAESFQKAHNKVLRDIRDLKCSDQFKEENFEIGEYQNLQGRTMPMYLVTISGFFMLCTGYSGKESYRFKEAFITAFHTTVHHLDNQNKQLLLDMENSTLLSFEQKQIQEMVRTTIYNQFPTLNALARRKYFTQLYQEIKQRYNVSSYRDIPRNQFEEALNFIQNSHCPKQGQSSEVLTHG